MYESRMSILQDGEDHIDWQEARLDQIRQMDLYNYMADRAVKD
jgi:bacterioferritin (cytochrome b1)